MEVLILSCSTGGGHNSAASAVKEEMERRGHHADMLDPYQLVGNKLDEKIGNAYVDIVRHAPLAFGCLYKMGEWYSKLPVKSPVYAANKALEEPMEKYIESHNYDIIFMTHIFPGQMIANLKSRGVRLPKTIYIATDYTCIPFTKEVKADYYVVPCNKVVGDFISKGIPENKILPLGIPVKRIFSEIGEIKKPDDNHYMLLSSGSIGVNRMFNLVRVFKMVLSKYPNNVLIVICGNNESLYCRLKENIGDFKQIKIIANTSHMAEYMKMCDVFIGKPGGLSSTEAAVMGVPLIHILPIPGCESENIKLFSETGMSIGVGNKLIELPYALHKIKNKEFRDNMLKAQKREINANSTSDICDFAESLILNK